MEAKKISFEAMSKILKKAVTDADVSVFSSEFLLSYAWIKEINNKYVFKQYRIEYFPEKSIPVYTSVPNWLNILLDGLECEAKDTIREGVKQLLKI